MKMGSLRMLQTTVQLVLARVARKIMERVVVFHVLHYLQARGLVNKLHYDLTARRPTTLNMFDDLDDITSH